MPRRTLHDRRALVTGASSGIGRELALELARRGARVLLAARREELLRSLADDCRRLGAEADYLAGDVTRPEHRAALVARVDQRWQGLDLLINNAGVSAHGPFAASQESTLRQIMEVNFFAAVELTRQALPRLTAGRQPAIVNIGSILGHRGVPLISEYCASKFALRGWSEALRAELASSGVHVLLVSPGTTETEFFAHLLAKTDELPWANSKAVSPAAVAQQTLRALLRRRAEIFPNWRGRALVLASRLAPAAVNRRLAALATAPKK